MTEASADWDHVLRFSRRACELKRRTRHGVGVAALMVVLVCFGPLVLGGGALLSVPNFLLVGVMVLLALAGLVRALAEPMFMPVISVQNREVVVFREGGVAVVRSEMLRGTELSANPDRLRLRFADGDVVREVTLRGSLW